MIQLLDSNALIAFVRADHVHHAAARAWLAPDDAFATCPITQGALLRLLLRDGASMRDAREVLASVVRDPRHTFWADDLDFLEVSVSGVVGHRQVTDAYLAALARSKGGRLATFDRGLAALHADVAVAVPS